VSPFGSGFAFALIAGLIVIPGCASGPVARADGRPPVEPSGLVGGCGPAPGVSARYVLPFTPGEAYELTQGNCGGESHGGRFRYSYDFRMPPDTPVLAARDGIVMTVRDGNPDGTRRVGDENFLIIRHPDGELSRYIHLRRDGALVEKGEPVAAGDTIALSGNSGRSAFPHLHFDVVDRCGSGGCRTIPSAFLNADPPMPNGRGMVAALPLEAATGAGAGIRADDESP
jgi:murein DD-endopeptidase MepM/ murein hydrolase activator NlpD